MHTNHLALHFADWQTFKKHLGISVQACCLVWLTYIAGADPGGGREVGFPGTSPFEGALISLDELLTIFLSIGKPKSIY